MLNFQSVKGVIKKRLIKNFTKHVLLPEEWERIGDAREFIHSYLEFGQDHDEKWVMTEINNGIRIFVDIMDCGVSRHILFSTFEKQETELISSLLKPGSVFCDIGANVGWYTLQASEWVGEDGKVFSFEPGPSSFQALSNSVEQNGCKNVRLYNVALSDNPGEEILGRPEGQRNTGGSFLGSNRGVLVKLETLDRVLLDVDRLDLIKMDVEGWEPNIIKGGRKLIQKFKPYIVSEISEEFLRNRQSLTSEAYIGSLKDMGYRCFDIETMEEISACSPGRPHINALFRPD